MKRRNCELLHNGCCYRDGSEVDAAFLDIVRTKNVLERFSMCCRFTPEWLWREFSLPSWCTAAHLDGQSWVSSVAPRINWLKWQETKKADRSVCRRDRRKSRPIAFQAAIQSPRNWREVVKFFVFCFYFAIKPKKTIYEPWYWVV